MKISQIIVNESMGGTCAGSVASVAKPIGEVEKRDPVRGLQPVEKVMKNKAKKKGPYANSIVEGKIKQILADLKELTDDEFQQKYKMTKSEARKNLNTINEEDLKEEDKIIAPGKGSKYRADLLSKTKSSTNPTDTVKIDVPLLIRLLEYAREDASSDLDLHDLAEKLVARGTRGKTLTMKDYEFVVEGAGVIAGGLQYEELNELSPDYIKGKMKNAFKKEKEQVKKGDLAGAVQTGKRIASVKNRLDKKNKD
jgi:hypothetical protein